LNFEDKSDVDNVWLKIQIFKRVKLLLLRNDATNVVSAQALEKP
jgi:hypothetical protein